MAGDEVATEPTRKVGGLDARVPDEFFEVLSDKELALWEGALDSDDLA